MFEAVLLYAGLGEVESVSLAKLEDGCCAGAVSGGGGRLPRLTHERGETGDRH